MKIQYCWIVFVWKYATYGDFAKEQYHILQKAKKFKWEGIHLFWLGIEGCKMNESWASSNIMGKLVQHACEEL